MNRILTGYVVVLSLIGLFAMGADKSRARKGKWRISEKTLFGISLLGGSLGVWAGMYLFRHKTRHWKFVLGMPLIVILQAALVWFLAGAVG